MFADLLGSVLVVVAGVVIAVSGFQRADPIASLVIAVMILPRAMHLLKESAAVLLEIAPKDLDLDDVRGTGSPACPASSTSTTCTHGRSPAACPPCRRT